MARMRSSERNQASAIVTAARNVDFKHLWRQLRAAGWTARKPTGLATEWTYVKPDATGAADEFVGDQAVVVYALESGLIGEDSGSSDDAPSDDEPVRASQIDTSVQLSQATLSQLFSSPVRSEVGDDGLSQSAVARAFDLSQSILDAGESTDPDPSTRRSRVAAGVAARAPLPRLFEESTGDASAPAPSPPRGRRAEKITAGTSDVFTRDSDRIRASVSQPERSPATASTRLPARRPAAVPTRHSPHEPAVGDAVDTAPNLDDSDVPVEQSPQRFRPSQGVEQDVNFISEDEDEDEYESLDSSDSDSMPYDDDEVEIVRGREQEEQVNDADAPLLDEAFLRALGGFQAAEELSKADLKRQDALRAMTWEPVRSSFEHDVQAFPGMCDEEAHPVPELRRVADDPLKTFLFFMPKSLWVEIADETNRYNSQQVNARAQAMRARQQARPPESIKTLRRRLCAEEAYGVHELLHLIGILIGHMLAPDIRRFSNHWRMTDDGTTSAGVFGEFMARNRCTDLLRHLHFVDNKAPRTRDKLRKLRAVSDRLQERFLRG